MMELTSNTDIHLALTFIVPGLIAVFVRAQFLTGRRTSHSEAVLSYVTLSAFYYALVIPILDGLIGPNDQGPSSHLVWFGTVFFGPALLGAVLGLNAQRGYIRRALSWLGLTSVHVMPTAWDWKFSTGPEQWVLVRLKDDTKFAGYCGIGSFMSSEPGERDLYIEKVYDLDDENRWQDCGAKSVLIAAGEVKTIEFFPIQQGD